MVPFRAVKSQLQEAGESPQQLESVIRLEMEDISDWPTDLAISVVPHEDSLKVEIMRGGPQRDADRSDMIEAIADRLRSQFDLKASSPIPAFIGRRRSATFARAGLALAREKSAR